MSTVFKNGILLLSHLPNEIALQRYIKLASSYVSDNLLLHLINANKLKKLEQRRTQYNFLNLVYNGKNIIEKPNLHVLLSPVQHCGDNLPVKLDVCFACQKPDSEIGNTLKDIPFQPIDVDLNTDLYEVEKSASLLEKTYSGVVIGGTFDHIHNGHKLLIATALMYAENKLTVGVADGVLLENKLLTELIEPVDVRMNNVNLLIDFCKPGLTRKVVPITDPCGPSGTDDDLQLLVVSQETLRGGEVVNGKRKENGLNALDVFAIDIIDDCDTVPVGETSLHEKKLSSSMERVKLLGSLRKNPNPLPENNVYVIGVTGGIASGKSAIVEYLKKLGAYTINCDKLGHEAYLPGQPAYNKIIEHFGIEILADDKTINRKKLGPIVFSDKSKLELLNQIVWPEIRRMRTEIINKVSEEKTHRVVVFEGAILFEAGWEKDANEIWCCVISESEAVKRIKSRDNIPEENALRRIRSQLSNKGRVERSHVIFCSQWEYDFTRNQVEKAWNMLLKRLERYNGFKGNL